MAPIPTPSTYVPPRRTRLSTRSTPWLSTIRDALATNRLILP
jgi:hypothetical protein